MSRIYNNPADVLRGHDEQLIGATKHLIEENRQEVITHVSR